MQQLVEAHLEAWMERRGAARRSLLAPLAEALLQPCCLPADHELIVEPARWLLEHADRHGLPLGRDGSLEAGFAADANGELGYVTPPSIGGERIHPEVDALLQMLRATDSTRRAGQREVTTATGRMYLDNLPALWHALAGSLGLGRPPGPRGEAWELALAWLVREDVGVSGVLDALEEMFVSLGFGDPFAVTLIFVLYTWLRALCAFARPQPYDCGKPVLRASGREAVLEGLRATVLTRA